MARILPILASQLVIFFFISSFSTTPVIGEAEGFAKSLDRKLHGIRKEKLSHFHFYWHDLITARKPTSVLITQPPFNSSTFFGKVRIIDNPLTSGPELGSKLVGQAQGFYAPASQEEIALLMVQNIVFTEGKYNGSTISVLGRNPVFHTVRELPVIGGSGRFRFARGYALVKTNSADIKTLNAVAEYNVYVYHY